MFCSSSSTSTTHLPGTGVNGAVNGDVESRALTEKGITARRPSVSAAKRSSTTRLRCGAATTSRVKGEERRAATTLGGARKTKKEGGSAPSAKGRL